MPAPFQEGRNYDQPRNHRCGADGGAEALGLAARCERAEGADRELDAEIAEFLGLRIVQEGHPLGRRIYDTGGISRQLPRYTASLDTAMTLVPKGWVIGEMSWWPEEQSATVHMDDKHKLKSCSGSSSPALTLAAAALRARAAIQAASD